MPTLPFDRRALLKLALCSGALALDPSRHAKAQTTAIFKSDPFTLGIASGDPSPDGFVLWTRLAPQPLDAHGGVDAAPVEVLWEIGEHASLKNVLRSGVTLAQPELAHSVHVEIAGLQPGRDYFYRFRAGTFETPIGRTRTLPPQGAALDRVRFAVAGCQAWESGYYTAWRGIANDAVDFVFHYGDYIYEHAHTKLNRQGKPVLRTMPEDFALCTTLSDYRRRYALYKTDTDLQAAHASTPFIMSIDDHEVANNWAADGEPRTLSRDEFLKRRAAAFQAWYEHMPVRTAQMPRGADVQLYRRFTLGSLADISVLDTRQYRSRQACGDGIKAPCADADDAARTILGHAQEQWFANGLRQSKTTWNVLAQQVLFAHLDWRSFPFVTDHETPAVNLDSWDGTSAARERMLALLREATTQNTVVLTGDMHRGVALDVKDDWRNTASRTRAVEFLATSISSGGNGTAQMQNAEKLASDNPHMKFMTDQRGYHLHTLTPDLWRADFRTVAKVTERDQPVTTSRSFVVEAGRPGLVEG